MVAIIPFYGSVDHEMFAIERRAMDRPGHVIAALDAAIGDGTVLDVGAGDGFTAESLHSPTRRIIALEPAAEMIRRDRPCTWVQGDAGNMPFRSARFDAAYATWAYFFSRGWDPSPGIAELHRVVVPGGPLLIVDNAGGDDFCALAEGDISADPAFWAAQGFEHRVIESEFAFESLNQARVLLGWFFGEPGRAAAKLSVAFNVAIFSGRSRGPTAVQP